MNANIWIISPVAKTVGTEEPSSIFFVGMTPLGAAPHKPQHICRARVFLLCSPALQIQMNYGLGVLSTERHYHAMQTVRIH